MRDNWTKHWAYNFNRIAQINLQEIDPVEADVDEWIDRFDRAKVEAVIVNSGGIFAYYPTKIDLYPVSQYLGSRDLFGEFVTVAKAKDMRVFARLCMGRGDRRLYYSHPDWFTINPDGQPIATGFDDNPYGPPSHEYYVACPNGPYYWDYTPLVIRELLTNYQIDGIFSAGWQAFRRFMGVCQCRSCREKFRKDTGLALPVVENWSDTTWRTWVQWRYKCMDDVWEHLNQVCQKIDPDAIWIGNQDKFVGASQSGTDRLSLTGMSPFTVGDTQMRNMGVPLWENGAVAKLMRSCAGDKRCFTILGTWNGTRSGGGLRIGAKPDAEQKIWASECVASGANPWWHTVGCSRSDRRALGVLEDFFTWHAKHDRYFGNRRSMANVAMVYSPRSVDFYGKDDATSRCKLPFDGYYHALVRHRIPFDVVHEQKLTAENLEQYNTLILPNIGAMSDGMIQAITAYTHQGGSVIATGDTSLYDEWGDSRGGFGLGEVLGVEYLGYSLGKLWHSALCVTEQHPAVCGSPNGSDEGVLLPFDGGTVTLAQVVGDTRCPMGLVPPFPFWPPEIAYSPDGAVETGGLFLRELEKSRVAYFAADVDRTYFQTHQPALGQLLADVIRWTDAGRVPMHLEGSGLIDCHIYKGTDNVQVHLVNLTNPEFWTSPADEIFPVGEQTLEVTLPEGAVCRTVKLLSDDSEVNFAEIDTTVSVTLPRIVDYEVVVLELEDDSDQSP